MNFFEDQRMRYAYIPTNLEDMRRGSQLENDFYEGRDKIGYNPKDRQEQILSKLGYAINRLIEKVDKLEAKNHDMEERLASLEYFLEGEKIG